MQMNFVQGNHHQLLEYSGLMPLASDFYTQATK